MPVGRSAVVRSDTSRLVCLSLSGMAEADVIVIGGGFTGLSKALHLREAGVDVAIVEAMEPGWVHRP